MFQIPHELFLVLAADILDGVTYLMENTETDGITDTRVSMWILLAGNVMNIIGNYILIYGKLGMPEMGVLIRFCFASNSNNNVIWCHFLHDRITCRIIKMNIFVNHV